MSIAHTTTVALHQDHLQLLAHISVGAEVVRCVTRRCYLLHLGDEALRLDEHLVPDLIEAGQLWRDACGRLRTVN